MRVRPHIALFLRFQLVADNGYMDSTTGVGAYFPQPFFFKDYAHWCYMGRIVSGGRLFPTASSGTGRSPRVLCNALLVIANQ